MDKRIAALTNFLACQLNRFAALLENVGRPATTQSKFVNLAPIDQADKDGVYSEALLFATTDPKVSNIALTGPYGSGKSSIIRTFLKRHPRSALHISLAAFLPEADKRLEAGGPQPTVSKQEIERSILQQLLYRADADKLPLSRFKRIKSPGFLSRLWSLYILLGFLALWYVFAERAAILSGTYFLPLELGNWFNLTMFGFTAIFVWTALHYFHVASFAVSLKSISLKNVELSPVAADQSSILNRHLDEIVYFFQSTDYDLVVIEDLDRFNNPDIFVTLREINSLVNGNVGVKRRVQFLYALRDDMFMNTDRTKFFEFIIPVIPIINSSNAIDMVLRQGKRLALDDRLNQQFLREVSRYLNDLRLISNIFNEYAIYVANLETDGENSLNPNKLLAVLIYKNSYPRDFELLHRGEGQLAAIFNQRDALIADAERAYRLEMDRLEQEIQAAELQIPKDVQELRRIYAMALIQTLPSPLWTVGTSQETMVDVARLIDDDKFDEIVTAPSVTVNAGNPLQVTRHDNGDLQSDVDPNFGYGDRMALIVKKSTESREAAQRRIRELREKIKDVRASKFNVLLRNDSDRLTEAFARLGEGGDLARFLLLEGHLDDSYYQYTSLFHSGRLSPNDNKFLRQIRGSATPDPDFPIDNAGEVIAAMRADDFGQSYVLNVKLVDRLLSDATLYSDHIRRCFEFVASHFDESEDFFEAYYATGHDVSGLLSGLADDWALFVPTIIASKRKLLHVTQLVASFPEKALAAMAGASGELPEFVAANLPEILALAPELAPERLEHLGFEIRDLPAVASYPGIVRFMVMRGLFELSIANLEHVYRDVLGETNLTAFRKRNYTMLRLIADQALMTRVEREFDLYLSEVLLDLEENTEEDIAAIIDLLRREELGEDNLREFLRRQTELLPSLDGVPEGRHDMVFELQRITPTWANCIAFMGGSGFADEILAAYLDREDVRAAILRTPLPNIPETLRLRQFLVNANAMSDDGYREYVRALPNSFKNFPASVDGSKLTILIEERKITFSKENLDKLGVETDLPVLFVAENIGAYLASPETFELDDDFRENLLRRDIGDGEKRAIVELMDMSVLTERPERAALIGPILDRTNVRISDVDVANARALILNSTPTDTQISLFNKLQPSMTVGEASQILAELPKPFSEISTGYHTPRLPKSDENRELVKWLDSRGIISSWSEGGGWFGGDEIRVNLKRR